MYLIKKIILTALLTISMITVSTAPIFNSSTNIAQAATIKISNKVLTLERGKTKTLSIKGTNKKVTWSSSKKTTATVSSNGKVTAKAVGTTVITASVAGKKFTCKVTVKEPVNPYLKNAPFDATEVKFENISLVIPTDWDKIIKPGVENDLTVELVPLDTSLAASVMMQLTLTGDKAPSYRTMKKQYSDSLTAEFFQNVLSEAFEDPNLVISDYIQSDYKATFGNVLKTAYNFEVDDVVLKQVVYYFYLDHYFLRITTTDASELGLEAMTEYIINSIIVK